MKKILSGFVIMAICSGLNQTIAQYVPSYSGMFNAGLFYGSNKSKAQVQTIHGVAYKGWFAGLGGGIDDYFQQSIPVFLDVRKNILNKESTPFIYVDGGLNIVTKGTEENWGKTKMESGQFYEGGVGYKVSLNGKIALNFAAGYSAKTHEVKTYQKRTIPTPPYILSEWILGNTEKYELQRFVMKVGLQF